jgi:hypothetical protein
MVEPLGLVGLSALTRSVVFCGNYDATAVAQRAFSEGFD